MIFYFFEKYPNIMMAAGIVFSFVITILFLHFLRDKLPADSGRDFAVEGALSKGKPQGAGVFFVSIFAVATVLFAPFNTEHIIYLVMILAEMMTGYLDDASSKPWGRVKKGILDLAIAFIIAFTYVHYNGSLFRIGFLHFSIEIPVVAFMLIIIALVWTMINVTNCADGVDGLSGTLAIISILSFFVADIGRDKFYQFNYFLIFFVATVLAYLLFNAGPSILLMGDAGSRAMGLFISLVALKSGYVLLIIPFALLLIIDGGLGLFKVTIIKITKNKKFMSAIRTPIHDHVRKNIKTPWSNNQVVMRFAIIQVIISVVVLYVFVR